MKPPQEWDEHYLFQLPIGEFDWLEVKGRRALDLTIPDVKESDVRANLSRAVSAFANSGGGILVFGLADPTDQWKIDDGGVELTIKGRSTREWLEDVIPNLVELPLQHFNVYVIRASREHSAIAHNRGVFLVEIRDSPLAPHQSADHRYYARVSGKSRPIGHQMVSDIFNRRQYPEIRLAFEIERRQEAPSASVTMYFPGPTNPRFRDPSEPIERRRLLITASNAGRVLARFVSASFWVPAELMQWDARYINREQMTTIDEHDYIVLGMDNTQRDVVGVENLSPRYGPSWFHPILPGMTRLWTIDLVDGPEPLPSVPPIRWKVFADNAVARRGEVAVAEIVLRSYTPPPDIPD